jgi:4'-phosphopantetheinyl transferase
LAFDIVFPILWKIPPSALVLLDQEVHVWQASLDQLPPTISRLAELLSEDERARAERFHFARDRDHFIVGRGVLRIVLGRYLGISPEQIRFQYGDHGKPGLPENTPLRFNLAHSNDLILIAVTLRHEIGVDLEYLHLMPEADGIASRFFTKAENKVLHNLPESQKLEGFFVQWVCKEAYLKAIGDGLAKPLDAFEILSTLRRPQGLLKVIDDPNESKRWFFQVFRPTDGYISAIAVERKDLKSVYWQWLDR